MVEVFFYYLSLNPYLTFDIFEGFCSRNIFAIVIAQSIFREKEFTFITCKMNDHALLQKDNTERPIFNFLFKVIFSRTTKPISFTLDTKHLQTLKEEYFPYSRDTILM